MTRLANFLPQNWHAGFVPAALGFAAVLLLAPAQARADKGLPEGTIAQIGSDFITEADFTGYLHGYVRQTMYHGGTAAQMHRLAEEAMDKLVDERLVAQEVGVRALKGDPFEADAKLDALRKRYEKSESWAQIQPQLDKIRADLLEQTKARELRQIVETVAEPAEDLVRAYYAKHPEMFTEPPSYDLDVIVLGAPPSGEKDLWAEAEVTAIATADELRRGADFAALARARSADVSRERDGKLGRVHKGQLSPEAEEAIATGKVGDIVGPVKVLEGYAVFRINTLRPAVKHDFESVRDRATQLYKRQAAQDQWAAFLAELRKKATVTIGDLAGVSERLAQAVGN